jgi:hypothetical protein
MLASSGSSESVVGLASLKHSDRMADMPFVPLGTLLIALGHTSPAMVF